jgi:hypothetical protein
MKLHQRLLLVAIASAVAIPCTTFAAKGERKKKTDPASTPTFASIDRNNDGSISRGEYLTAMKDKLGEQAAIAKFNALDADKNNRLSAEEFNAEGTASTEKKKNNKRDKKKNK